MDELMCKKIGDLVGKWAEHSTVACAYRPPPETDCTASGFFTLYLMTMLMTDQIPAEFIDAASAMLNDGNQRDGCVAELDSVFVDDVMPKSSDGAEAVE